MERSRLFERNLSTVSLKRQTVTIVTTAIMLFILVRIMHNDPPQIVQNEAVENDGPADIGIVPNISVEPVIKDRVAVLIETRQIPTLVPVLLHFAAVLGREWPIILLTNETILQNLTSLPSIQRHSDQISIRALPNDTDFGHHGGVSYFLTRPWLWEQLAPAEHIFIFQTDSMICANAPTKIDEFFDYDFVGAPINSVYGKGYNGGFSLRNRPKVLEIISQHDWDKEKGQTTHNGYNTGFEDQWFIYYLEQLPNPRLPSVEVAKRFSIETLYRENGELMPLGFHQITRYVNSEQLEEVQKWCPEISLMIGRDPRY